MQFPAHLQYTKDHEWISATTGTATIGITAYAVDQLGDIVHIDLPEVGAKLTAGDSFGTVESTKTVSDLYTPADGVVTAVNSAIVGKPEDLGTDPYEKGWLVKVEIKSKPADLMSHTAYASYLADH